MVQTVKVIVRQKLNDITTIDEPLLDMTLEEIQFVIQDYCSIDTIPVGLKYVWANMVEDLYRYYVAISNQAQGGEGTDTQIDMGDVTQLKLGDTTITVDASKNNSLDKKALKGHNANLDSITRNYKQQLNKYRRMVW